MCPNYLLLHSSKAGEGQTASRAAQLNHKNLKVLLKASTIQLQKILKIWCTGHPKIHKRGHFVLRQITLLGKDHPPSIIHHPPSTKDHLKFCKKTPVKFVLSSKQDHQAKTPWFHKESKISCSSETISVSAGQKYKDYRSVSLILVY